MAAPPPLVTLRGASLAIAERSLFSDIDLSIARGDRICLVGRNGSGKSSLMRVLAGLTDLDRGQRFLQPGVRVAYLPQTPHWERESTVRSHVAAGLPPEEDAEQQAHRIDAVLAHLSLDGTASLAQLSGGEGRRTALARALVGRPEVLLLDEPTNHLDLPTIEWLEGELAAFKGGILLVSHDRAFLAALSRQIYWLDRGRLHRTQQGFSHFQEWSERLLAEEQAVDHRLKKKISEETRWLREGLTARRKRNMGRVRALQALRRDRAELLQRRTAIANIATGRAEAGGSAVIEVNDIWKSLPAVGTQSERIIAAGFSTRILRGDRIGLVGRNGAGKTTLLRLLMQEIRPDRGKVKVAFGTELVYFDQKRESLDPERSLWGTLCPDGGDTVMVRGRPKHVVSYLRDFLFEDRQAQAKVKSLSGGERNRLLLAKLFAAPHNLLVLDEPTNDLDMETLELLQDELAGYDGTILVVSHDRDFLDRVVTATLVIDGRGGIVEYAGGYTDMLAQRPPAEDETVPGSRANGSLKSGGRGAAPRNKAKPPPPAKKASRRLGYMEQRELDQLPDRIVGLEARIADLEAVLADPALYGRDPKSFEAATTALEETLATLAEAEERWLELEAKREALANAGSGVDTDSGA